MGIWLIFFLVCFAGLGFMFFCILRRQDAIIKSMREEHGQFKVLLRSLAARLEVEQSGYTLAEREVESPISVDDALASYSHKEREEKKSDMPDLKL